MHDAAYEWVRSHAPGSPGMVLEIGGRNINGTIRDLFHTATTYVALDYVDGDGVDVVADAATWEPDRQYDTVVCCEVFEHTPAWRNICRTAYTALAPGGLFIITCAGPGRAQHSAVDGGWRLHPGEHYQNVTPNELREALETTGFRDVHTERLVRDTRAIATK